MWVFYLWEKRAQHCLCSVSGRILAWGWESKENIQLLFLAVPFTGCVALGESLVPSWASISPMNRLEQMDSRDQPSPHELRFSGSCKGTGNGTLQNCLLLTSTQARLIGVTPQDSQGTLSRLQLSLHSGLQASSLDTYTPYAIWHLWTTVLLWAPHIVDAQGFALVIGLIFSPGSLNGSHHTSLFWELGSLGY